MRMSEPSSGRYVASEWRNTCGVPWLVVLTCLPARRTALRTTDTCRCRCPRKLFRGSLDTLSVGKTQNQCHSWPDVGYLRADAPATNPGLQLPGLDPLEDRGTADLPAGCELLSRKQLHGTLHGMTSSSISLPYPICSSWVEHGRREYAEPWMDLSGPTNFPSQSTWDTRPLTQINRASWNTPREEN